MIFFLQKIVNLYDSLKINMKQQFEAILRWLFCDCGEDTNADDYIGENADEGDNGDVLSTSTWRRVPWPLVVVREEWGLAVEVTF